MQLVPRDPPLAPCMVGSSGKIRAVVVWKEEWTPELVLKLCLLRRCGQSRAYLVEVLPYKHPRKRRELCS